MESSSNRYTTSSVNTFSYISISTSFHSLSAIPLQFLIPLPLLLIYIITNVNYIIKCPFISSKLFFLTGFLFDCLYPPLSISICDSISFPLRKFQVPSFHVFVLLLLYDVLPISSPDIFDFFSLFDCVSYTLLLLPCYFQSINNCCYPSNTTSSYFSAAPYWRLILYIQCHFLFISFVLYIMHFLAIDNVS